MFIKKVKYCIPNTSEYQRKEPVIQYKFNISVGIHIITKDICQCFRKEVLNLQFRKKK